MDGFIQVATVSELKNKPYKTFRFLTKSFAVFPESTGGFYAMEVNCKHQNANLLATPCKGDIVTCSRHGWQFNLRTGACLTQPWARLRRIPIQIVGEEIWVCPTRFLEEEEAEKPFF